MNNKDFNNKTTVTMPDKATKWQAERPLLHIENLSKTYGSKDNPVRALRDVSLDVYEGEFIAIMGPSGSGKTTLLNCISTVDRPSSGLIYLNDVSLNSLKRKDLAKFRNRSLGFLFQDYNLLETMTAYENIHMPMSIAEMPYKEANKRIRNLADYLKITPLLEKFPAQLSGGERQRVAAARAFVMHPAILLADEPTGALDTQASRQILDLLKKMQLELGATIIMVTHDQMAASYASRVIFLRDGMIDYQMQRAGRSRDEFFSHIMDVSTTMGGAR